MLFSSVLFIWIFLPIVLTVNLILSCIRFQREENRFRAKNLFLLFASMVFYAWGGIGYLFLMLFSILLNFVGGYAVGRLARSPSQKKAFLWAVVAVNLGLLFYFKYFNMLGLWEVALPIGISFFTFQAMSYVFDVYREKAPVQGSLSDFALYVSLFPQLIAGPIVQYGDIAEQLKSRRESLSLFFSGQKRFCYGMAKKVVIANTMAEAADQIWALETTELGAPVAWLGMIAYTLQIYYDFSGYSDMAIGIGRMLGFQFKENFRYPYTSLSVREFWRRWHISLSSWFREYVYIPLGGSRGTLFLTCRNLFIVFLLTGIWHGANFTFWAWGLYYAVLMLLERLILGRLLDKNPLKPLNWVYTIFAVMVGWVFFRSDSLTTACEYIRQLFRFHASEYSVLSFLSMKTLLALTAAVLCSGFLQRALKKFWVKIRGNIVIITADSVLQLALLAYSIVLIVSGTYNPFIYFQF
ncbi:MAG: MBOAT family protein [Eubacterium sp.]|nr:MBOAT family protein [Eubacterium sp.]MCM1303927.1 MBOAT family protein [Butyrivibrio sp.]MCM1344655.1 MBOAT family protein [Muribaculaceae bacterium]MCM1411217.1 MBOAT family protein [Lachnospiraceae bacterium]